MEPVPTTIGCGHGIWALLQAAASSFHRPAPNKRKRKTDQPTLQEETYKEFKARVERRVWRRDSKRMHVHGFYYDASLKADHRAGVGDR